MFFQPCLSADGVSPPLKATLPKNGGTMRAIILLAFISLVLLTAATIAKESKQLYKPIFSNLSIAKWPAERGTFKGDFVNALKSNSLQDAKSNWASFLEKYGNKDLGDAFEGNHLRLANFELMRVYYLLGDANKGDELIQKLATP